jgi:DNA-directed RNA polymerase specialized sigma subunit
LTASRISFVRLIESERRQRPAPLATQIDELTSAIEDLPVGSKTLLGLLYQESCSFEEVALILDISEAEARAGHAAALADLALLLEP